MKNLIFGRKRTLTRLVAVQILFQFYFFNEEKNIDEIKNELIQNYVLTENEEEKSCADKIDNIFLDRLIALTLESVGEIDIKISSFLKNKTEELPSIILQILRLGASELMFLKEVPPNVAINEYVNIAGSFFDKKQLSFVNSVLENIKPALGF
jgi:N utilization substance protein B